MNEETSKHTPGPWAFKDLGEEGYLDGIQSRYTVNSETGGPVCHGFDEERMKLAAAAPDLLKALKEAIVELGLYSVDSTGEGFNCPRWNDIIAKAGGPE